MSVSVTCCTKLPNKKKRNQKTAYGLAGRMSGKCHMFHKVTKPKKILNSVDEQVVVKIIAYALSVKYENMLSISIRSFRSSTDLTKEKLHIYTVVSFSSLHLFVGIFFLTLLVINLLHPPQLQFTK